MYRSYEEYMKTVLNYKPVFNNNVIDNMQSTYSYHPINSINNQLAQYQVPLNRPPRLKQLNRFDESKIERNSMSNNYFKF